MIPSWLGTLRPLIDADLEQRLSGGDDDISRAVRYAALGAGKRLRPALALACCEAAGGTREQALPAAAAVELLHAYTLVHDDLPALDDDDERRGRPTVHKAFGDATAILTGDALLTAAFGALAGLGPRAAQGLDVLATRTGHRGLIRGQMNDLALAGSEPSFEQLEAMHADKTGALFAAAAELGAIAAGAPATIRDALGRYGMAFGIAFQFADDADDADFPSAASDRKRRTAELTDEAIGLARPFGARGQPLVELVQWISGRV